MKFITNYKTLAVFFCAMVLFSCNTTKNKTAVAPAKTEDKKEEAKTPEVYYTEQIRNDFRAVSENTQYQFLEAYKATEKQYSILFFTQGFNGEDITVKNNKGTLYKGSVTTNKTTGLAKNMRIVNTETTSIYDKATKKTIYIHPEKIGTHKFVYIMKGNLSDEKPYKITYSDKLRPEK